MRSDRSTKKTTRRSRWVERGTIERGSKPRWCLRSSGDSRNSGVFSRRGNRTRDLTSYTSTAPRRIFRWQSETRRAPSPLLSTPLPYRNIGLKSNRFEEIRFRRRRRRRRRDESHDTREKMVAGVGRHHRPVFAVSPSAKHNFAFAVAAGI